MAFKLTYISTALLHAVAVAAQSSNTVNLAGIISEAAGLASALGTPVAASTSSPTPTSTSATSSSALATSSTAATPSATSASATPDPSSGGLTPQARTIIIAVCVVGGLLILGILLGLLLCCCIRRRRKHRRLHNQETAEVRRDDWERGSSAHHGYVSSSSDLDRAPRLPNVGQADAAPLMSETPDEPAPISTLHPAYRTHSWDGSNNVNARNPFTPNPPIKRKPIPNGRDSNGHPLLAAGAGAALGAAAVHHHNKHRDEQHAENSSQSYSGSYPSSTGPLNDEHDRGRDFRDPNRPPTPFGLNAFGVSPKRSSNGAIEPSVAAHDHEYPYGSSIDHPTEAQRRSLQEREMLAAEPPVPERSPKRTSFGAYGARGSAINPDETPQPAFLDTRNDTDTSNESWQSAPNAHPPPQQPSHPYWDDGNPYYPEPRRGDDQHAFSNVPLVAPGPVWREGRDSSDSAAEARPHQGPFRRYGADGSPRRSVGADGRPRRLRFSDLSPEEYHYDYDGMHNVGQAL